MWKVKRMNTARIVVLTIAVGAGGIAAYLASGSDNKPLPTEPVAQLQTVDVLVAKSDIGLGQSVTAEDLQWQTWPAATASNSFIRRNERPDATTQIVGSIARAPFIAGEPIREPKLVKANGSGFMAAILPTGMRAISTEISPETGAGGFILPNDRVDVILSKRDPRGFIVRRYHPGDPRQMAAIRLIYPKISAIAGPCGLWPDDLGPSIKNKSYFENKPYYNFGCAYQRNMAAMIDNPSDLVQPRSETPAYTTRRTTAFEKYRKGTSTATNYPEADRAKLSDTGK